MSVTNVDPARARIVGNGVTVVIPFTFPILDVADVDVFKIDTGATPVAPVKLVIVTDYNVTTVPAAETGTVTLTAPSEVGFDYLVIRDSPDNQALVITEQEGTFNVDALETAYDKLTLLVQELDERVGRSLKLKLISKEKDADVDDMETNKNKMLLVNANEDGFEYSSLTFDSLLVEIQAAVNAAEAAAAAAASSAANALASANNAAANATAAAASEVAAAASAVAALASEVASAASAAASAASAATALSSVYEAVPTENIAAAAAVTHSSRLRQLRRIQGTPGAVAMAVAPFGIDTALFSDGQEITLECVSDARAVTVPTNGGGAQEIFDPSGAPGGDSILLRNGYALNLVYNSVLNTWINLGTNF